ncbi:MAG TPA: hypothetical protein VH008_04390 [Pseudonocardia sp.]|nr:hypothetical protein [Pseudonocardia sp.]
MSEADGIAVPSTRELLDDWLAVLTLMGERDASAIGAAEVFTRSIGRRSFDISLETRVTRRDQQQLAAFTAAIGEMFNRQATAHWLVEERLIAALGNATGESRAEIIQQLALRLTESAGGTGSGGTDTGTDSGGADNAG